MRILVVSGGVSDEREISLRSGKRVFDCLQAAGEDAVWHEDNGEGAAACLEEAKRADAVFLALHGGAGEDGTWQRELEAGGVFHYTGSGAGACALAMQKDAAKRRVSLFGIPVAQGVRLCEKSAAPPLSYPFVVKPNGGGSSVGLSFVEHAADWEKLTPSGDFLCEKYLSGREFTIGILGGAALPAVEIRPRGGRYDYAHKYEKGATLEICPAPLSREQSERLSAMARASFTALGLRDYARIDLRENALGIPHFLEANALPGMTETSLFPLAAATAGWEMPRLCQRMCRMAMARRRA